jgi:hypothetical protein
MDARDQVVDFGKYGSCDPRKTFFQVACESPAYCVSLREYEPASLKVARFHAFLDAFVDWVSELDAPPVETYLWSPSWYQKYAVSRSTFHGKMPALYRDAIVLVLRKLKVGRKSWKSYRLTVRDLLRPLQCGSDLPVVV